LYATSLEIIQQRLPSSNSTNARKGDREDAELCQLEVNNGSFRQVAVDREVQADSHGSWVDHGVGRQGGAVEGDRRPFFSKEKKRKKENRRKIRT
jgi:hypothetical protein